MVCLASGLSTPEFRAQLRRHRQARRWSQERMAGEIAMDCSLISRLEAGRRPPTRESVERLCDGLHLGRAEAESLWLAAGFLPPSVDAGDLTAALALVRGRQASGGGR